MSELVFLFPFCEINGLFCKVTPQKPLLFQVSVFWLRLFLDLSLTGLHKHCVYLRQEVGWNFGFFLLTVAVRYPTGFQLACFKLGLNSSEIFKNCTILEFGQNQVLPNSSPASLLWTHYWETSALLCLLQMSPFSHCLVVAVPSEMCDWCYQDTPELPHGAVSSVKTGQFDRAI